MVSRSVGPPSRTCLLTKTGSLKVRARVPTSKQVRVEERRGHLQLLRATGHVELLRGVIILQVQPHLPAVSAQFPSLHFRRNYYKDNRNRTVTKEGNICTAAGSTTALFKSSATQRLHRPLRQAASTVGTSVSATHCGTTATRGPWMVGRWSYLKPSVPAAER